MLRPFAMRVFCASFTRTPQSFFFFCLQEQAQPRAVRERVISPNGVGMAAWWMAVLDWIGEIARHCLR